MRVDRLNGGAPAKIREYGRRRIPLPAEKSGKWGIVLCLLGMNCLRFSGERERWEQRTIVQKLRRLKTECHVMKWLFF